MTEAKDWHSRPLDEAYSIVYLNDELYVNIKVNGQVSKPVVKV